MSAKAIVQIAAVAVGAFLVHGEELVTGGPQVLNNGVVYDVNGSVEIRGDSNQRSGLRLANGTAYINLKKGSNLKVIGGNASGTAGAGAGIEIGEGATLFITGDGEVFAQGGAAADGCPGHGGDCAEFSLTNQCMMCGTVHTYWGALKAGRGGLGGNGGGGAGAGIGGCGGYGGAGGNTNGQEVAFRGRHNEERYLLNGINGENGQNGTGGGKMGQVVVSGMARVRVCGGGAGAGSAAYGTNGLFYASSWTAALNLYTAVGGGGGGGGAGGGAADGIGGGGGGGGGGGSGGSGGYFLFNAWENVIGYKGDKPFGGAYHNPTSPFFSGRGGRGGAGEKGEVCDKVKSTKYDPDGEHKNGNGGDGGHSAGRGEAGLVYVTLRAGLDDQTACRYAPPPPSGAFSNLGKKHVAVFFYDRGKEWWKDDTCFFMGPLPGVGLVPTRVGYRFTGWWTPLDQGNICFYDQSGKPMLPYLDQLDDIRLEARWEADPSALVVMSNGDYADGAERGDDHAVTLRDAVKALCDNPSLTGTNGARRITFALPKDKSTITLTRPIVIPAGTEPLELFGLCGGGDDVWAVTIDGGGKTRLLEVNGEGIALSHLNFSRGSAVSATGGAILCDGATLDISDCSFIGNEAKEGGAIGAKSGATLIRQCTFAGNSASARYGAVSASGLTVALNSTFSENTSHGTESAAAAIGLVGNGLVAYCSFVRNGKSIAVSNLPDIGGEVMAVNSIFADGDGAIIGKSKILYSGMTNPLESFVGGGMPQTNVLYGVKHVWYEPKQTDANFDAANLYYDGYSAGSAIAVKGVVTNILFGTAAAATVPVLADQLRSVRFAPVRGAIRIISGEDRPGVIMEGIYANGNGEKSFKATVRYDDGQELTGDISVAVDADGFFSAKIPVEGSDGTAHNAVSCRIQGMNQPDEWMSIATLPYAFAASSATALLTDDQEGEDRDLVLPGDAVTMNRAVANSVAVKGENGWLEVASQSFSAGTVRGFGRIELDGVNVTEGRLDVLQDWNDARGPDSLPYEAARGPDPLPYGDLTAMTAKGNGALPLKNGTACISGEMTLAAKDEVTLDFGRSAAKGDGFVQIFVRLAAMSGNMVGLKVGSLEVTPLGSFGSDGRERRFLWTVPVRKGDVTELTLVAGAAGMPIVYQRQYMYFGVLTASELDDVEK